MLSRYLGLATYCSICGIETYYTSFCFGCFKEIRKSIQFKEILRADMAEFCDGFYSFIDYHQFELSHNLLQLIKYRNMKILLSFLIKNLPLQKINLDFDIITYIPISYRKYLERGFNQSKQIAKYFSSFYNKPLMSSFTKIDSISQANKTRINRLKSIHSSIFKIKRSNKNLEGLTILVIDDIITTGATIAAVSKNLKLQYGESTKVIAISLFHSEN